MKCRYDIKNLECAGCAKKVENALAKDSKLKDVNVNFATLKVTFETNLDNPFEYAKEIIAKVEPDAILSQEEMPQNKNSYSLLKLLIGLIIGVFGVMLKLPYNLNYILIGASYIILMYKRIIIAGKLLLNKKVNENILVVISALGALILGKVHEGLMVIFLYELGKLLEDKAVNKTRKSIKDLMDLKEDTANVKDGKSYKKVKTEEVKLGDIIIVKEGEKIPLDGTVVKGKATIDTSMLTGESALVEVKEHDKVLSSTINKNGLIEIKVTSIFKDSTVNKVLELTETATEKKSVTETIVSRYSGHYTIGVIIVAILVSVLLPLFTKSTYSDSIYKGLSILVIACPCAIAISVPLSYFSGIGLSSKNGILVKGSNYLDSIRNIKKIIFDKTGTITTGNLKVSKLNIEDNNYSTEEVLNLYAIGESYSNHPIAKAILEYANTVVDNSKVENYKEISGSGIKFDYQKDKIKIGNKKFCKLNNKEDNIYLTVNDKLVASMHLQDEIKEEAKETINTLNNMGIETYIFTGDAKAKALSIGRELNIKEVYYELLPEDKYHKLEEIIKSKQNKEIISFVGDGINDAPVIALSDLGISMGGIGTDAAIEASDVVIMDDNLSKIVTAIKVSKKTNKIINQNLIFAVIVKLSVLILSIAGISTMWEAVFADVGVTILCILNTLRLLKKWKYKKLIIIYK